MAETFFGNRSYSGARGSMNEAMNDESERRLREHEAAFNAVKAARMKGDIGEPISTFLPEIEQRLHALHERMSAVHGHLYGFNERTIGHREGGGEVDAGEGKEQVPPPARRRICALMSRIERLVNDIEGEVDRLNEIN